MPLQTSYNAPKICFIIFLTRLILLQILMDLKRWQRQSEINGLNNEIEMIRKQEF